MCPSAPRHSTVACDIFNAASDISPTIAMQILFRTHHQVRFGRTVFGRTHGYRPLSLIIHDAPTEVHVKSRSNRPGGAAGMQWRILTLLVHRCTTVTTPSRRTRPKSAFGGCKGGFSLCASSMDEVLRTPCGQAPALLPTMLLAQSAKPWGPGRAAPWLFYTSWTADLGGDDDLNRPPEARTRGQFAGRRVRFPLVGLPAESGSLGGSVLLAGPAGSLLCVKRTPRM
jgi:hypothetical protein